MQPGIVPPRPTLLVGLAAAVAAAAFAVGGAGGYALYEHRKAEAAIEGQEQLAAQLQQTRIQMDQLNTKVSELAARPPQVITPPPLPEPPPVAVKPAKPRGPSESQRLKKMQSQLDQQGKAIADTQTQLDATKGDLSNTRTELGGSIARTHDELVVLQKKGERNYYEFDLVKSKQFEQIGPLGLSLRKTNTKHRYYDMAMVVDDRQLNKKQVNLYEPLLIYPADSHQPLEIVVNRITRDGVHGYVSTPKYTEAQIAALGAATSAASTPVENSSPTQPTLSQRPTQP